METGASLVAVETVNADKTGTGSGCGMERYGHKGYLIKVVVMALAGEVTQELSPIRSWSNKNYKI